MAFVVKDRVRVATATAGTGAVMLGAAVQNAAKGYYRAFAAAGVANGDTVPYLIEDGANWEIGIGTYVSSGTQLQRTTVLGNSAGNTSAISLSGAAEVAIVLTEQVFNLLLRTDLANQALAGGFTASAVDDGTKTVGNTYALTPSGGNFRKAIANGVFSIAAPTAAGCYNLTIDLTNGSSAGAITFSGFIAGYPKGDPYTTGNGQKFKLHVSKTDAGATATLEALQ